ncbi:TetR/AcrR family transcriptional regulator [Kribbella capetownensis]|uniref:TetR/AcrR family transcriptional regulator n=1 Tax=Kribbella capetownensis TaxID=1572659 RepID=A0A4R0K282_9ACTN|nr:TetR/AcrR family transcriptional regulator [Kribbella capetownensis]TCC53609.1 TetR/AcrR family transcriptional regulator [Kribbella capetownensis]
MVTRTEWLEAGLELLADEGAPAVTIERLTGELGVTKGSYYHHFKGAAGYRTALLEYFEARFTTRLIDTVEREPDAEPLMKLQHLLRLVLSNQDNASLEIAVRAWALQDPEVRAAQERVDRARTEYLKGLCRGFTTGVDADRFAELLYLILIGAEQVLPPIDNNDLRDIYLLTLRLATGETLLD